jgi:biotin carboxyl carrier protein
VTYEVEINGRTRRVEIERLESGYAVSLDGRRQRADVTVINGLWSLILGDNGSRQSHEIAIVENPPASGNLVVHVNGRRVTAAVGAARGSWAQRGADTSSVGNGPRQVTAPMPGKIVKVLVKTGDTVAARQGVVVVEAMKMENELRAPRAGIVAQVNVTEGASVEAGAILIVID